jgi:hypothetical protein
MELLFFSTFICCLFSFFWFRNFVLRRFFCICPQVSHQSCVLRCTWPAQVRPPEKPHPSHQSPFWETFRLVIPMSRKISSGDALTSHSTR